MSPKKLIAPLLAAAALSLPAYALGQEDAGPPGGATDETDDTWAAPPQRRVIDLHVTSEPSGSEVIVAGQVVGQTPVDTQFALPAEQGDAPARVTVSHEGFQPQTITATTRGAIFVHVTLASIAPPEPEPEPEAAPIAPGVAQAPYRHEVWGGLGFFGTDGGGNTALNTVLEAHGRIGLLGEGPGALLLDLTLDWAAMFMYVDRADAEVRALNPLAGVLVGAHVGPVRLMGGVRLGVPLTAAYDDSSNLVATVGYALSTAMRGARELGMTSFSYMEASARGELDYDGGDVRARLDVSVGALIGVEPDRRTLEDLFMLAVVGQLEGLPHESFGLGAQAALVYFSTVGSRFNSDTAAFSIAPFARFYFLPGWVGARLLMNMDAPFGFSFDGGTWGLFFEGGARF